MNKPARQVCPLCGNDELQFESLGPGIWTVECPPHRFHPDGGGAYRRQTTLADDEGLDEAGGITEELGLYHDLPQCLVPGEPLVEYGVVEHRYKELRPEVYRQLLERYGHTRIAPKSDTTSAFIALALGRLADWGEVVVRFGPATGYWSYNGAISYWALPPAPAADGTITWAEFALSTGLDPKDWILPT